MGIQQTCILEVLEKNGYEPVYIDVHTIGSVAYHFEECVLTFRDGCVPNDVAQVYLRMFGLEMRLLKNRVECECEW